MLRNRYVYFRYPIVLAFLLFACTPSDQTQGFYGLVFPNGCRNACWIGIEPKSSTTDEAIRTFEDFYGSENVKSENFDEGRWLITWNADNANWQNRGTVSISNDIVDDIFVWFPENRIAVQDLVNKIGEPDSVGLVPSGPVVKCAAASLSYSQSGLIVFLYPNNKSVGVSETQAVGGFEIRPPWKPDSFPVTDTRIVPWDGYHEYCPEKWPWEK